MIANIDKKGVKILLTVTLLGMGPLSTITPVHAESVTVPEESQSANALSKLQIVGIELDKPFSPSETKYSAIVENQVSSIQLLVESTSPNATITINGKPVITGTNLDYQLETGENLFTITISDSIHPVVTYQLIVTREKSSNNQLQNIALSSGKLSPNLTSSTTEYSVQVANDQSTITIKPTAVDSRATVKVNGKSVQEGGELVDLPVGDSIIVINVVAENGAQKNYTITVTRAAASLGKSSADNAAPSTSMVMASSNAARNSFVPADSTLVKSSTQVTDTEKVSYAKLSSLSVSVGTWDSEFSADEYTYHISVSHEINTVTINPIAAHNSSSIVIEGGTSQTIQLNENKKTVISIVVNYSDDDRKTYVLVFDKN
ncbi:cadherin-like beta sandwich domain-containing protein [Neobacillus dielmonensis]|uniref:cadherin-like beta sandwich domain-containing protein n=1 Tax=Neobacillus dielmonensis TaxID=1347369 RepID=UPI0005AA142C|nr:cadherin-like beta sandwich domain-containing protein [Neobacillus dielmonensis]